MEMAGVPLAGANAIVWLPKSTHRTRPSMTSGGSWMVGGWDAASDARIARSRPITTALHPRARYLLPIPLLPEDCSRPAPAVNPDYGPKPARAGRKSSGVQRAQPRVTCAETQCHRPAARHQMSVERPAPAWPSGFVYAVRAWMMLMSPTTWIRTSSSRRFEITLGLAMKARNAARSENEPSALPFTNSGARLASNQRTSDSRTARM